MVAFTVLARIEQLEPQRYAARAVAIPVGVSQRAGPEERRVVVDSLEEARDALAPLIDRLSADIRARGNSVLHDPLP